MTAVIVAIGLLGLFWFTHRYAWWRQPVDLRHPRILMYHMIGSHKPRARFNKLRVETEEFERQVRWLKEQGWNFVFMSELLRPVQPKTVAITFDDGYRDNLLNADPVLRRYGAKATLYLVVDRHNRDWSSYKKSSHDDGELMHEPKLADQDMAEMLSSNRWELGAHTLTHAYLPSLSKSTRSDEILSGKKQLEATFGVSVLSFAYPFGIYESVDVEYVRQAGFRTAVTTNQGISENIFAEMFALRRIKVNGHDGRLAFWLRMRTGKCRWHD